MATSLAPFPGGSTLLQRYFAAEDLELYKLAHDEKTITTKLARFEQFVGYWQRRSVTAPFEPVHVQYFCYELVARGYRSVGNYLWSIRHTLQLPPIDPRTKRTPAWLSAAANITNANAWHLVVESVRRAIKKDAPGKARPLVIANLTTAWSKIPPHLQMLVLLWYLAGLREDSVRNLRPGDIYVNRPAQTITIIVCADKVLEHQNREVVIGCNCCSQHGTKFCPLHFGWMGVPELPPARSDIEKLHKLFGTTGHSYRVAHALQARRNIEDGDHFALQGFLSDKGWKSFAIFATYTLTHDVWRNAEFLPIVGAIKHRKAKAGDTTKGKKFPKDPAEAERWLNTELVGEDAELREMADRQAWCELAEFEEEAPSTDKRPVRAWWTSASKSLANAGGGEKGTKIAGATRGSKNGKAVLTKLLAKKKQLAKASVAGKKQLAGKKLGKGGKAKK